MAVQSSTARKPRPKWQQYLIISACVAGFIALVVGSRFACSAGLQHQLDSAVDDIVVEMEFEGYSNINVISEGHIWRDNDICGDSRGFYAVTSAVNASGDTEIIRGCYTYDHGIELHVIPPNELVEPFPSSE